jgi:hypothetical protein
MSAEPYHSYRPTRAQLAARIAAACTSRHRLTVEAEAADVVRWASQYLDALVIDECIGWTIATLGGPPERPTVFTFEMMGKAIFHNPGRQVIPYRSQRG